MAKELSKAAFDFDEKMPLSQAFPLGLQHVLAMFVGNLTPILVVTGLCGLATEGGIRVHVIQNAMFVAGAVSLVQIFSLGPIGGKVPIIMGTSSGFIGVMSSIAHSMGGGVVAYAAILGAGLIGGVFEMLLGFFLKFLRKFFPSVVTGTVVLSIGLSLIIVGINSFGGGNANKDFGSIENLFVSTFVLIVILVCKHKGKGVVSTAAILIGIVAGYILTTIMGFVRPTTFTVDGAEVAKSWVVNWRQVAEAKWFSLPRPFFVKPVFKTGAILPLLVMMVVTAVETVGDISAVVLGGMGREATDKELSGGIMCDGFGTLFSSAFSSLPTTSFSQNVGLVAMTKVVNKWALGCGALILVACGLVPKFGAIFSIMPQAVLGGAAVMMFSSIILSGIQLVMQEPMTPRNLSIVSIALGVGYGMGVQPGVTANLPALLKVAFGESGIVPAAFIAILLNIILPKDKK